MLPELSKIKGVHPGLILKRELTILNLKSVHLANVIDEHKQTISAIINKRRDVNPKLSIKLSRFFDVEEDYFMLLQASYDVKKTSEFEMKKTPNLKKIRRVLFWDTSFDKINWLRHRKAIIKRVLERGNKMEIEEIILFYGKKLVKKEVSIIGESYLSSYSNNIDTYQLT